MDEKLRRKISDGNIALKLDKDLSRMLKNNNINLDLQNTFSEEA